MLARVAWQWRTSASRRLVRSPAAGAYVAGAQINRVHYIVAAFGDAARFLEAGSNNPADALQSAGGTPVKVSEAVDKYKKDVLQTLHDVVRAALRHSRTCARTACRWLPAWHGTSVLSPYVLALCLRGVWWLWVM